MSCSSKSGQKRKLQAKECGKLKKKKMAWDSFTSIRDFGYEFNKDGRLVDIESGEGFNFYVSDDDWYNQKNYEMLGEVITEYVYELLQSEDVGLKLLEIPFGKGSSHLSFGKQKNKEVAKGFIFVSEDYDKKEKLLVLVHGSGVVKAGQWARRLIINDCLDHGTQIPYIKKALEEGYGVIVTNTNQNEATVELKGKKMSKTIKESESPERHFTYVWKNIIEKTKASKLFFVAHSYGGYLVVNHFSRFPKIQDRAVAVAFTDSVHSLRSDSSKDVRKWFLKNSVNWVTSDSDLDVPMYNQDDNYHVTRVSAGTTKHEETSWKAMNSVFRYFQIQESEFDKPKDDGENKKASACKSGKNKPECGLAPQFDHDKISKKSNKNIPPGDSCISSEVISEHCSEKDKRNENKDVSNLDNTNQETTEESGNDDNKDGTNEYVGCQSEKSENSEGKNNKDDLVDKEKEGDQNGSKQNKKNDVTTENAKESTEGNASEASSGSPEDIEKQLKKEVDEIDSKTSNETQSSKLEEAGTNSEDEGKPEQKKVEKEHSTMNQPDDSGEIHKNQNKEEIPSNNNPATRESENDSERQQTRNIDEISDSTQNPITEQPNKEDDKDLPVTIA